MKKATSLLLALFLMLGISEGVNAQVTIASDDGSQTPYNDGWSNTDNGGSGFDAWSISYGANTGTFIGDPSNDGMDSLEVMGASAFGMYANGTEYLNADRIFQVGLQVGDTLTFYWAINWDANPYSGSSGGSKGFDLKDGSTTVINVNNGGSSTITYTGGTVSTDYGTDPMFVTLVRASSSEYSLSITKRDGSGTFTGTVSSTDEIDRIGFYIGNQGDGNSNRNMYVNNFVIKRASSVNITGSAGYRLLSAPTTPTLSTLLDPVWTQATTGADTDQGDPNVFTWPTAATDGSDSNWNGVTDLTATLSAGSGVLVYVFDDTDYNGSGGDLPVTLSVTGTENGDVTGLTVNSNADGWTLVGNPFASTIDFDLISKTDLTNVAYVWDPATSAWKTYETSGQTGDLTDGLITPFQGFFIQTASSISSTPDIDIESDDKSSGGTFYGKEVAEELNVIRLQLDGAGVTNSMWMQFSEEGSFESKVMGDALELEPLAFKFAKLSASKAGELMDIAHLPLNESFNLPLDVSSTESGEFTLKATDFTLPAGMSVVFHDYQTGFEQEITEDFEYKFELGSEVAAKAVKPGNLVAGPLMAKSSGSDRFGIAIQPTGTSTENTDTPAEFALEQNYPNPFNPSTTIQYSVAEPGQVSLSVYNLMGQRVAELVNETKSAGTFNVSWNASNAASGMYYYRLVAGGKTITRKMTLIK